MIQNIDYIVIHFFPEMNWTDVDVYNNEAHLIGFEQFPGNMKEIIEGLFEVLGFKKINENDDTVSYWSPYSQHEKEEE